MISSIVSFAESEIFAGSFLFVFKPVGTTISTVPEMFEGE